MSTRNDSKTVMYVKITIIRSNRKTLSIQLKSGEIIARAPLRMKDKEIYSFIEEKRSWIYFTGMLHKGLLSLDSENYTDEVKSYYTQHINSDGSVRNYAVGTLDAALPAVNLISLLDSNHLTEQERMLYQKAVNYVYNQLENQVTYPQAGNLMMHGQTADRQPVAGWTRWSICLDGICFCEA